MNTSINIIYNSRNHISRNSIKKNIHKTGRDLVDFYLQMESHTVLSPLGFHPLQDAFKLSKLP